MDHLQGHCASLEMQLVELTLFDVDANAHESDLKQQEDVEQKHTIRELSPSRSEMRSKCESLHLSRADEKQDGSPNARAGVLLTQIQRNLDTFYQGQGR